MRRLRFALFAPLLLVAGISSPIAGQEEERLSPRLQAALGEGREEDLHVVWVFF